MSQGFQRLGQGANHICQPASLDVGQPSEAIIRIFKGVIVYSISVSQGAYFQSAFPSLLLVPICHRREVRFYLIELTVVNGNVNGSLEGDAFGVEAVLAQAHRLEPSE